MTEKQWVSDEDVKAFDDMCRQALGEVRAMKVSDSEEFGVNGNEEVYRVWCEDFSHVHARAANIYADTKTAELREQVRELVDGLKTFRAYFGIHDTTVQEHNMYTTADRLIKKCEVGDGK